MAKLVNQKTNQPTRKVTAGAVAGALVTAVVKGFDIDLDPEVVAALTTLVSFGISYFVKERE